MKTFKYSLVVIGGLVLSELFCHAIIPYALAY